MRIVEGHGLAFFAAAKRVFFTSLKKRGKLFQKFYLFFKKKLPSTPNSQLYIYYTYI